MRTLPAKSLTASLLAGSLAFAQLACAPASIAASPSGSAASFQVSYVDQGQIWVSTLDGKQKRAISGAAPSGRQWTEQTQSDDGWIFGVARKSGYSGAAAPTKLWKPGGDVAAESTLGYDFNMPSAAVPIDLALTTGAKQVAYTYSYLAYSYPVSSLYQGTWVTNTSNTSITPINISNLLGTSVMGSRLLGVDSNADDAMYQEPTGVFSPNFAPWFNLPGMTDLDVSADGKTVALTFETDASTHTKALGLIKATGLGGTITADCVVPTAGDVSDFNVSPDGSWISWVDTRGLLVGRTPISPATSCDIISPVLISKTGTYPAIGSTQLATSPGGSSAKPKPKPLPSAWIAKWPKKSSQPKVGKLIKVGKPAFSKAGKKAQLKVSYRWYAAGKAIKGATKQKLRITKKLRKKKITVKVTVSKAGYASKSKTIKFGKVR
ncbi:hypothetical protein GCM10010401_12930 [Rarobacter faecitabidus]|uniref:WD40 repeat protein n=1 Tax=Rarobacter faecitabidus TaxID=13243 RepID=A0A542ZEA3_RARFA|nr:hypothetical protein [Rarobacter faecitabidus]TQL58658.1 hypothetical protein FB461_2076 [Rarobacter faecitabidus]